MNTLIIGVETKGAKEAATELDHLAKSGEKAEEKTKGVGKGAGQTVAPFKAMRGATQQASFQLQDIAVQAQSGTDAFIIIGQQGPQLASIFGPGGAVFGALIAFGALIGGLLVSQLNTASEAFEALDEDMKTLGEKFDALGPAAKAYERSLSVEKVKNFDKAIAELSKEQEKGIKLTYNHATGQAVAGETTEAYTERQEKLAAEIERLNSLRDEEISRTDDVTTATEDLIEQLNNEYNELTLTGDALYEYQASQVGATGSNKEAIIEKLRLIQAYKDEQAEIKANARAAAKLAKEKAKAAEKAAKEEQRLIAKQEKKDKKTEEDLEKFVRNETAKREVMIAAAQENLTVIERGLMSERELLQSHESEELARITADRDAKLISLQEFETAKKQIEDKGANDRTQIAVGEEEAKNAVRMQSLNALSGFTSQLSGIAEEGSKEAKVLFALQKAIAIAQIIVSTEVAANAAAAQSAVLGGPLAWFATATGIRTMGYASAGLVAGTAIAGRATGGQVRSGESYLVGERGPELLSMGTSGRIATNENLKRAVNSDQESSKTQNVNVNFSIVANDTTGFDRLLHSRRGQIVTMINQAVNNRGRASLT